MSNLKSGSVEDHGKRIADALRKNGKAYNTGRIAYATFNARANRLWRMADAGRDLIIGGVRIHERLAEAVHRSL